jgi:hypothetical protein
MHARPFESVPFSPHSWHLTVTVNLSCQQDWRQIPNCASSLSCSIDKKKNYFTCAKAKGQGKEVSSNPTVGGLNKLILDSFLEFEVFWDCKGDPWRAKKYKVIQATRNLALAERGRWSYSRLLSLYAIYTCSILHAIILHLLNVAIFWSKVTSVFFCSFLLFVRFFGLSERRQAC